MSRESGARVGSGRLDFDRLTLAGRSRRLRAVAWEGLEHFDIEVTRVSLLRDTWNTMFRVDAADGRRYVLRVSRPEVRTLLDIQSELAWLQSIRRETDIPVSEPVVDREGSAVVTVTRANVPGPRYVSLFRWVGGRHTHGTPSSRTITGLAETMARLHEHADTFRPPREFTTERFDRICGIATVSRINSDEPHPLLPAERRAFFRSMAQRVQEEMDRLYAGAEHPRFLHLDMHLGNVKLLDGRLTILDFDDSMWAYPIQDIGISLYYLMRYALRIPVVDLFRTGYERVRLWPEEWPGQVFLHVQARALELIDVVLELERHDPRIRAALPRILDENEALLRGPVIPESQ